MKNYIEILTNEIVSEGKLYFTLDEVRDKFKINYESALKFSLNRLIKKGRIVSLYRGFYLIIPPEYSRQKILPPELFIDAFFKHLNRIYYIGLISAAFYHGASHQQPQEYFVLINKPAMRSTRVSGLKINYIVNSNIQKSITEDKKSKAGYIKISSPEQTAIDLVRFQNRIGGLNRASTIIYELADSMKVEKLQDVLPNCNSFAILQRLGFLLDTVVKRDDMADVVNQYLSKKKLYRMPLKPGIKKIGAPYNRKWKIIENFNIEIDL